MRTPTLAGRYADELNAYPAPPEEYAEKVRIARSAAKEAGRDPEELLISSSGVLVAGDTEDEYRASLERFSQLIGSAPDEVEKDMELRNTPRGSWAEVRDILQGLEGAGMQRFWIQAFGSDPSDVDVRVGPPAGLRASSSVGVVPVPA